MLLPASPCSSDHRIVEQVNKSNKQHQGRLDSGHFWGKQGEFSKKTTNPPPHNVGLNPPHMGAVSDKCRLQTCRLADWQVNQENLVAECFDKFPIPKNKVI